MTMEIPYLPLSCGENKKYIYMLSGLNLIKALMERNKDQNYVKVNIQALELPVLSVVAIILEKGT